jgi:predicted lipid-binding transport protein (Tim44 family)
MAATPAAADDAQRRRTPRTASAASPSARRSFGSTLVGAIAGAVLAGTPAPMICGGCDQVDLAVHHAVAHDRVAGVAAGVEHAQVGKARAPPRRVAGRPCPASRRR